MTYAALALCCALLSYGAVNAVASVGVALFWRYAGYGQKRCIRTVSRPRNLLLMRVLPSVTSALFVLLFFFPGFVRLEPRDTVETVSPLMLAVVSVPVFLFLWGGGRGVLSWLATRRIVRDWTSKGKPLSLPGAAFPAFTIDSDFPVVSLAGVLRPCLFLSRQVAESCTAEELRAVVAHEAVHRAGLDNLKRLFMRFCPDFLALTPMAGELERAWCDASEVAADESATRSDRRARSDLAEALVKVARLAAGRSFPCSIPASAFHRGGNIARRVRLLLGESPPTSSACRRGVFWGWLAAGGLLVFSLASEPKVLEGVHRGTELIVTLLQ